MKWHSVRRLREKIRGIRISEIRSSVKKVEPAIIQTEFSHLESAVGPHEELGAAAHLLQSPLLAPLVLEPDLQKLSKKTS